MGHVGVASRARPAGRPRAALLSPPGGYADAWADPQSLSDLVRGYIDRVVNRRDPAAVDELVSVDYTGGGHGWPSTLPELRAFYEWQAHTRPDWHIEVQETIEVDDCVVVRAFAGGTISKDEQGIPLAAPKASAVEWVAAYRLADGQITRIDVLALQPRTG